MKRIYNRRYVLRGLLGGATAYVGLPLLESMLHPNGQALANGASLPKRYGQFFWGAGTDIASFPPLSEGANWQPSPSLMPLANLVNDVTVVSGLDIKFRGPTGHQEGHAGMLAGAWNNSNVDPNLTAVGGPTLDQVLVRALNPQTAYPSVQVASSQVGYANYPVASAVSWINPNTPNSIEYSPENFYRMLFSVQPKAQGIAFDRKSILDVVRADLQAIQPLLGATDKQRIEAHTDGIRQLELKLAAIKDKVCMTPNAPGPDPQFVLTQEQVRLKHRLFVDMIAMALSCDLTRIFSIQYTGYKGDTMFWEVNAPFGYHATTHFRPGRDVQLAVRYIMEDYAYLVEKLKNTPDGAGTLLDQSLVYATSDLADGFAHSTLNMPALLAGKAGGALQSGVHIQLRDRPNASNVLLSILKAMGVNTNAFGQAEGYTTQTVPGLLRI